MLYNDQDVSTWLYIDQDATDIDELARMFIAQEVDKAIALEEDTGDSGYVLTTVEEWTDSLSEELEFQLEQYSSWVDDDNYDQIWERVEELLPYFLENYSMIKDRMVW